MKQLQKIRDLALCQKIGVSLYDPSQIYEIAHENNVDVIQVPASAIDQRILQGDIISFCKKKNIEIKKLNRLLSSEREKLQKLRNYVEKNFEYVGENFSKKVREIYYDKKNQKAIYGTTTHEEREELADEGIDLLSIPWVNKDN